jgi:hypothetical protein
MGRRAESAVAGQVLEQGDIFFFRRLPEAPSSRDGGDMESLFFILHPLDERLFREVVIGRGRFPAQRGIQRQWGLVYRVMTSPDQVRRVLGRQRFTGGEGEDRERPAARPIGQGIYVLAKHKDHTHLAYALETEAPHAAERRESGLEDEASWIIAVKNPETAESSFHPELRRRLAIRFHGRRWIPADPVDFLDVENVELVLIPGRKSRPEGSAPDESGEADHRREIFRELKENRRGIPIHPLFEEQEEESWA